MPGGREGGAGRRHSHQILTRQHIFISVFVQILRQLCKRDGQTGLLSVQLLHDKERSAKPLQKTAMKGVGTRTINGTKILTFKSDYIIYEKKKNLPNKKFYNPMRK